MGNNTNIINYSATPYLKKYLGLDKAVLSGQTRDRLSDGKVEITAILENNDTFNLGSFSLNIKRRFGQPNDEVPQAPWN